MDFFKLYDQFTTNWEKIRAYIVSHLIAAFLLWLVGFEPPLPDLNLADLQGLPDNPTFQLFENLGFLALLSLGLALIVGFYAVILNEVGKTILAIVTILAPPMTAIDECRRFVAPEALFTIVATLPAGCYQGPEVGPRFMELLGIFSVQKADEFKAAMEQQSPLQRDATTHLRNALVFVVAWCLIPWLLEGTALATAVEAVFWRGLAALLLLVYFTRARHRFAVHVTVASVYLTLSGMIQRDPQFAERLAAARANPAPYWQLVNAFRDHQPPQAPPGSLGLIGRLVTAVQALLIAFGLRAP